LLRLEVFEQCSNLFHLIEKIFVGFESCVLYLRVLVEQLPGGAAHLSMRTTFGAGKKSQKKADRNKFAHQ
jgi:hypothetical protein